MFTDLVEQPNRGVHVFIVEKNRYLLTGIGESFLLESPGNKLVLLLLAAALAMLKKKKDG